MAKKPASSSAAKAKDAEAVAGGIEYGPGVRAALFKGSDAFLRASYTDRLKAAIEKSGVPVDVIRFDGASAQPAEVLDECRSFGLMRQHKLVIVDQADEFLREQDEDEEVLVIKRGPARASTRELVEAYLQAPTEGSTLVLRSESWRPGRIDKLIPKVGVIEDCNPPEPHMVLAGLIRRTRERCGCELERSAAEMLIERMGLDLGPLTMEVEKLSLIAGPGKPITLELVRQTVGVSREEDLWAVQPALVSGSADEAVRKVRELLEVSLLGDAPLRVAMIDLAKKLHSWSRGSRQGVPIGNMMRVNWMRDPAVKAGVEAVAGRAAPDELAGLLKKAVEADYRSKSGRDDHEDITLEALACAFARVAGGDSRRG